MDEEFFKGLESALTSVGSDACWKRRVGGVEWWIAPITYVGQAKVVEAIGVADPRGNMVGESKRIALSHSIVGFGDVDLRPYRDGQAVFAIRGREGKDVKVSLDKYLYHKISGWSAGFVDDLFEVYADLMESHKKQNLQDIKFENAKDPREELAELMVKVTELREQLGMPELVARAPEPEPDAESEVPGDTGAAEERDTDRAAPRDGFDPFRQIQPRAPDDVPPRAKEIADLESSFPGVQGGHRAPEPMQHIAPIPAPVPRPPPPQIPAGKEVHSALPSVPSEVIEERSPRVAAPPPVIDRPAGNRNPRFQPPGR